MIILGRGRRATNQPTNWPEGQGGGGGSSLNFGNAIAYNDFDSDSIVFDSPLYYFNPQTGSKRFHLGGSDPSSWASLIADPTSSGKGTVWKLDFPARGVGLDSNLYCNLEYGGDTGPGLGSSIFTYSQIYIPAGLVEDASFQRKLYYHHGSNSVSPFQFYTVVIRRGTGLLCVNEYVNASSVIVSHSNQLTGLDAYQSCATFNAGQWNELELQQTMNSTQSAADGIVRLWLNRVLVFENTSVRWTDPAWGKTDANCSWWNYNIGTQKQDDDSASDPESRYFKHICISTARVAA